MVVEGLNKIYFHKQGSLFGLGAGEVSGGNLLLSDARILDEVVEGAENIGILKGLPKARDGLDDASDYMIYRVGDEVVLVRAKVNVWEDIILIGRKGVVEALCCGYQTINEYIVSQGYIKKVSVDFIKYKNRGGTLDLKKYSTKHEIITRNRMRGEISEDTFLDLEKGLKPQFAIQTSDGARYIDNLLNGTARELKSGKITLNNLFKRQVLKDIEIIAQQLSIQVQKIEWPCVGWN